MVGVRGIAIALVLAAGAQVSIAAQVARRAPASAANAVRPFQIRIPDTALQDLRERLARGRLPNQLNGAGWSYGTERTYLAELVHYWRNNYDWRAQERQLNQLPQFTTTIDELDIHFVHRRSPEPTATPLLLIHGWSGSFYEFAKVVEPLANPRANGGRPEDAFHVVVASLPGYAFSSQPREKGFGRVKAAAVLSTLMARLGYVRYGIHAGDVGHWVAVNMALADRPGVTGMHQDHCYGGPADPANPDEGLTADEIRLKSINRYDADAQGYRAIQSARPQTLGYGLNDSPVGLAAWLLDIYRNWCDCDGDVERAFTKDEILTNVMIYWLTQSVTSSMRYYYEGVHLPEPPSAPFTTRVETPTACTVFPGELLPYVPRRWANTMYDVRRFTMMPRGGHFPAVEEPTLLVEDIRAFFATLR